MCMNQRQNIFLERGRLAWAQKLGMEVSLLRSSFEYAKKRLILNTGMVIKENNLFLVVIKG